jgi:uncharacterized protein RhaS with RHS repeats
VIQLSGNGTSSYTAGATWYLNGEDSQGLSYEKEVKDSGVTEHRHYMSAGGLTFALVIARTGTGVTSSSTDKLAQNQLRYFHSDHLGSISVITDEAGQVIERLAYDPWGKRRNANGVADSTDSLNGQTTRRGLHPT